MTREGFAANNRGIAAGGNLEESFLNEIFDHIRANPISLKEDDKAREKGETQVRRFTVGYPGGGVMTVEFEVFIGGGGGLGEGCFKVLFRILRD